MTLETLKRTLIISLLAALCGILTGAEPHAVLPGFYAPAPPVLDGVLDEEIWRSAQKLSDFKTIKPDYGKPLSEATEVLLAYDANNIYVAFNCYDRDAGKIKASLTKRDNIYNDDFVGIAFDTFCDNQSGFGFVVNPQGVQGDGMMSACGDLDPSADFIWYSKGRIHDRGYTVECRIPAASIRFPDRKDLQIKVMAMRQIVRTSEMGAVPEVPAEESGAFLSHAVPVSFSGLKYKRVIEILPAFTHSRHQKHADGIMEPSLSRSDISFTAKVGLTSGLTMDATYNPDFSQVEADAGQVDVNLRYSLYYEEKRPFFQEGMEVFSFAGNTESAPLRAVVHTRNIADPVFGLKLSGKLGSRNSMAVLYAKDELLQEDGGPKRADFAILRFRHALNKDAYLGGFLTSRSAGDEFNRVVGADGLFRLNSASAAEFHLLGSFSRQEAGESTAAGHALALKYSYSTRKTGFFLGVQDVSRDFQIDSGFILRDGLTRLGAMYMYRLYPESTFFQRIEPFYWGYHIYDKYSDKTETFNLFCLRFQLPRSTSFRIDLIAANEVFAGKLFDRNAIGTRFYSQLTRKIYASLFFRRGGAIYYDEDNPFSGTANELTLVLDYQPTDKFTASLSASYEDFFRDSDSRKEYDCLIVRSRNTFQLNKYLYVRGIGEYNTYNRRFTADFLASFTYIPGTVVHLGYGAAFDRLRWEKSEYVNSSRFLQRKRGFFFKVSYLWRL